MSYANSRVSNPVDCRIGLTIFGNLTAQLLLLISAEGDGASTSGPNPPPACTGADEQKLYR